MMANVPFYRNGVFMSGISARGSAVHDGMKYRLRIGKVRVPAMARDRYGIRVLEIYMRFCDALSYPCALGTMDAGFCRFEEG